MSENNNATGIVLPYENAAMRGEEMPTCLEYPDQVLFQALAYLYARYNEKHISREAAQKEKKKLLEEYRQYQFRNELEKQWVEQIRLTELARAEYRKNPTPENGMKLVYLLEGRKIDANTL